MTKLVAAMQVTRDGRRLGVLTADKRVYRQREENATEVGIRRAWNEDLYLILAGVENPDGVFDGSNSRPLATFRVLVNPLVSWIWLGGMIMAFGTLIAMWPEAEAAARGVAPRVSAKPRRVRPERELVGA
jgi:cytochrome c-type biogenesis protein CcmF